MCWTGETNEAIEMVQLDINVLNPPTPPGHNAGRMLKPQDGKGNVKVNIRLGVVDPTTHPPDGSKIKETH